MGLATGRGGLRGTGRGHGTLCTAPAMIVVGVRGKGVGGMEEANMEHNKPIEASESLW